MALRALAQTLLSFGPSRSRRGLTGGSRRSASVCRGQSILVVAMAVALEAAGCSVYWPGSNPPTTPVHAQVVIATTVGQIQPVFVALTADPPTKPYICRESAYAIDTAGRRVDPISPEDAGRFAGEARLLSALQNERSNRALPQGETYSQLDVSLLALAPVAAVTDPLWATPSSKPLTEEEKLGEIKRQIAAISFGTGNTSAFSKARFEKTAGFLFFPIGSYSALHLTVFNYAPVMKSGTEGSMELQLPWKTMTAASTPADAAIRAAPPEVQR